MWDSFWHKLWHWFPLCLCHLRKKRCSGPILLNKSRWQSTPWIFDLFQQTQTWSEVMCILAAPTEVFVEKDSRHSGVLCIITLSSSWALLLLLEMTGDLYGGMVIVWGIHTQYIYTDTKCHLRRVSITTTSGFTGLWWKAYKISVTARQNSDPSSPVHRSCGFENAVLEPPQSKGVCYFEIYFKPFTLQSL